MLPFVDGPYRAPRPLTEAIQPDRRAEHAIVFGIACMIVGALLFKGVGVLLEPTPTPPMMAGFGPTPPDLSTPPTSGVLAQAAYAPQAPYADRLPEPPDADDVASIVALHRPMVKDRCWHARPPTAPARGATRVTVDLVVSPSGNVLSSTGAGTDTEVANCVATQAMAWRFPARTEGNRRGDARGGDTHLSVPFTFVRGD